MHFPIIDVYEHPNYGDSVRYENYVELQEVAEKLEARHRALREAVAWERECIDTWEYGTALKMQALDEQVASMSAARAEVDRLIANEGSADCEGKG